MLPVEPLISHDPALSRENAGKKRAVSFGDATDYYSTGSGTSLLSFSYTLDVVSVSDVNLYLTGLGGCVSYVGVDTR